MIYIGVAGWQFEHWRCRFYPCDLPPGRWLRYVASRFNTVEVNVTFYRVPEERQLRNWAWETPRDFVFAIKAPKVITHERGLEETEEELRDFLKSVEALGRKKGPILFQLPASFTPSKMPILEKFLSSLSKGAYAVEVRGRSWARRLDELIRLLERYNVAYVINDNPELPPRIAVTADFAYLRLHGHGAGSWHEYCYSEEELRKWAKAIKDLGIEVYAYFLNDYNACAPLNALKLLEILGRRVGRGLFDFS